MATERLARRSSNEPPSPSIRRRWRTSTATAFVDLISTTLVAQTFVVQFGDGVGHFGAPLGYGGPIFSQVAVDDFNGDGRPDVAIGDESGVVRVFPNSCGGVSINLSITVSDSPDPVAQGDIVTYTATVRNLDLARRPPT